MLLVLTQVDNDMGKEGLVAEPCVVVGCSCGFHLQTIVFLKHVVYVLITLAAN